MPLIKLAKQAVGVDMTFSIYFREWLNSISHFVLGLLQKVYWNRMRLVSSPIVYRRCFTNIIPDYNDSGQLVNATVVVEQFDQYI
jgi:hypothetical protein